MLTCQYQKRDCVQRGGFQGDDRGGIYPILPFVGALGEQVTEGSIPKW